MDITITIVYRDELMVDLYPGSLQFCNDPGTQRHVELPVRHRLYPDVVPQHEHLVPATRPRPRLGLRLALGFAHLSFLS